MRVVYYGVVAAFAIWGAIALNLAQPLTLNLISANVAGFIFVMISVHTLVVNRNVLPPQLRPALWREAALIVTALFYGALLLAVVASLMS